MINLCAFCSLDYLLIFLLRQIIVQLRLEELLFSTGPYNSNLVPRMRGRFSGQVIQAVNEQDAELARDIYLQAEAHPQTETEHQLEIIGYQMNGPWHVGYEAFVMCYQGTKAYLLKSLTNKEYLRASTLQQKLVQDVHPHLTSFELRSHRLKKFMIMPFFSSTLEMVAKLNIEQGSRVVQQVSGALQFLHGHGFNHMDVKPANVCLNEAGDAVLVDLGSCEQRSSTAQPSTSECTVAYVPHYYEPRSHNNPTSNKYKAEEIVDWWMLATTVAEKFYREPIGGAAPPPTRQRLMDLLQDDFSELVTRLTMRGLEDERMRG
jgi:serine/threonine protein kinase